MTVISTKGGGIMSKKDVRNEGVDRRTFLKVTGAAGMSVVSLTFGVPKLLRAAPSTIKIGSIQPATGPLAFIGQGQRKANSLAVDYINSKGGIKSLGGAKLELLLADSESKAEVGRSEADRLIKDGAVMLIGPFQSGVAMAIATLAEQRQVPFVMDVAAMDAITQKGYKYTFRVFVTGSSFAKSAVHYLDQIIKETHTSPKRAIVTNTGDPFGKSQGDGFIKAMKKAGMPIEIVDHIVYPLGIQDLSAEIARIKSAKPDMLFPVCRPGDSAIMTRELFKQRVELMGIFSPGSPGWYEPKVIKDLGKLVYYVMDTAPWYDSNNPIYQQASKQMHDKYDLSMDLNTGFAYTGILVIADALERAGSTQPDELVKAIKQTNLKAHPLVGDAIKFNENGDNINATCTLLQVIPDPDPVNRVKVVLPEKFAQAKYVFPAPQLWERK